MNHSYRVDRERWSKLTIFEQMGNIGSEVGRTFLAGKRNDATSAEQALVRALDLFEATTAPLLKHKSPRAKEVLRAKEQFLQIYADKMFHSPQAKSLDRYFLNYAIAAQAQR